MKMKAFLRIGVSILIALAITACQLATLPSGSAVTGGNDPSLGPVAELPDDQIGDVARGGEFAFETYVSVGLDLDIELVAAAELAGVTLADAKVIATVANPEGEILLRAAAIDGNVGASFGVATATPYVTLTLGGVGVHERSIIIENPAELESVSRTMSLSQMSAVASRAQGLVDSDGDGVPDIYDAYPNDATIAFEQSFPGDGAEYFTIAFEDNFPKLGDGDYNDFVAQYNVKVQGINGNIFELSGSATALAKVAGYDHEFGLMFRIPGAVGVLTIRRNGEIVVSGAPVEEEIRVPLFESTTTATSNGRSSASFTVLFDISNGVPLAEQPVAPFDPYLYIKNTDYDVHLIGQSPLPGSSLSTEEDYRDAAGFPRALLVPSNFRPPRERRSILSAYPAFGAWVEAEGGLDADGEPTSDWYFSPNDSFVMSLSE